MRSFEITFYRDHRLVSQALFQGNHQGQARSFARMLMSCREADTYQVEEI